MSKEIVYLIVSNGVDGRSPETIDFASNDEEERNKTFDNSRNKKYYRKADRIIDQEAQKKSSLAKLNALDRLTLNIELKKLG